MQTRERAERTVSDTVVEKNLSETDLKRARRSAVRVLQPPHSQPRALRHTTVRLDHVSHPPWTNAQRSDVPRSVDDRRDAFVRTFGSTALSWQGGLANKQCCRGARQRGRPGTSPERSIRDKAHLRTHHTAAVRTVGCCDHCPKQVPCVFGPATTVTTGRRGRGVGGRQADLHRRTEAGDPEGSAARHVEPRQSRRRHGMPQDGATARCPRLQCNLARAAPQQGLADHGR